jgi:hypothetical protein
LAGVRRPCAPHAARLQARVLALLEELSSGAGHWSGCGEFTLRAARGDVLPPELFH